MKTILFLDIDGVLSIPNREDYAERRERWPTHGVLWPIPMASSLVRAIDADPRVVPAWLSCWSTGGHAWNDRAGTPRWPVGYPLCKAVETRALRRFPECQGLDRKLLAARWLLRDRPRNPVVWIEDGFAEPTKTWASQRGKVTLVDTWPYEETTATFLRTPRTHARDQIQAAQRFLAAVLAHPVHQHPSLLS